MSVLAVPRSIAKSLDNQPKIELRTTEISPYPAHFRPGAGPKARPEYHPRRPKFENFPGKKRIWPVPNRADRQANKRRETKQARSPQLRMEKALKYDDRSMLEAIRRYQYS